MQDPWVRAIEALVVLTAAELVAACSSPPSAAPAIAAGTASIEAARASGAADHAAVYLTAAESKLDKARRLAASGSKADLREARRLAEQANVDARFAQALSGASRTQRSLDDLQGQLRDTREATGSARRGEVVVTPVAPPPAFVPKNPP